MQEKDRQHPAMIDARRAVELLLRLGRESVHPDILADRRSHIGLSPLAGQDIAIESIEGMCVGPGEPDGNFHVTLRLRCNGREVEAYCLVTRGEASSGGFRTNLIQTCVYFDGQYVIKRDVMVMRDGRLKPVGMPDGFAPIDVASQMPA